MVTGHNIIPMRLISASPRRSPRPPRTNRRERRRAEIRDRLFQAALQLFADRGFLETTVADITEAADVGKGTFFNYFPTKEHVLATFGEERVAMIERAYKAARLSDEPVLGAIHELLTSLADAYSGNAALLRAIYAAHASCPDVRAELQKRMHRGRQLMTRMFQLAQERDEIGRDVPAAELARLTQLVFMGVMLSWAMNPDSSLQKTTEAVWDLVSPNFSLRQIKANRKGRKRAAIYV
jgi:AcrR family transcriptional regulator